MDDHAEFLRERQKASAAMAKNAKVAELTRSWLHATAEHKYSYHFDWCGLPIIQYPQDIVAMQELIWSVRPRVLVETGIARGGSLVLYASLLGMLEDCGLARDTRVVGVDIDIRAHNRQRIEAHPLSKRIDLVQGSSVDAVTLARVRDQIGDRSPVMICLDSNHTHDHVLAELERYAPLVSVDSYIVVFDTIVEFMPEGAYPDRPWSVGNNSFTAVKAFLEAVDEGRVRDKDGNQMKFETDVDIDERLLISVNPQGYLKRVW
jgi:cephalosporin hydroxylase